MPLINQKKRKTSVSQIFERTENKISEIELLRRTTDFLNIQQSENIFLFISCSFLIIIFLSGFIKIFSIKIINDFNATLKRELGENIIFIDVEINAKTNIEAFYELKKELKPLCENLVDFGCYLSEKINLD